MTRPGAHHSTWVIPVQHQAIYHFVDPRFHYGELRLSRLNKIYRFAKRPFLRVYMWGWNTYTSFFSENFALLASVMVYVAVVRTAMQVGLSTTKLIASERVQNASAGFSIFSIVGPLAAAVLISIMFIYLFVTNLIVAVEYKKGRLKHIYEARSTGE